MTEAKTNPSNRELTRIKLLLKNPQGFVEWLEAQPYDDFQKIAFLKDILIRIYENHKNGSLPLTQEQLTPLIHQGTQLIRGYLTALDKRVRWPTDEIAIVIQFIKYGNALDFSLNQHNSKNQDQTIKKPVNIPAQEISSGFDKKNDSASRLKTSHYSSMSKILAMSKLLDDVKHTNVDLIHPEEMTTLKKYLPPSTLALLNEKHLAWFHKLVQENPGRALYELARCFESGNNDLEINTDIAISVYIKAAKAKNADAMCYLGHIYEYGVHGVKRNLDTAFKYYQQAEQNGSEQAKIKILRLHADHGNDAKAKFKLGQYCFNGYRDIIEKDRVKGLKYIFAAAQLGHPAAKQQLKASANEIYDLAESLVATGKVYNIQDAMELYRIIIASSDSETLQLRASRRLYSQSSAPPVTHEPEIDSVPFTHGVT